MVNETIKSIILLVEDEAVIALAEQQVLEAAGYQVYLADSGDEALRLLDEDTPVDLVLIDIDLGRGMDGTACARAILENREVPVVFLTNHGEREVVDKVKGITRYGYIKKDAGDFVLLESVERALDLFAAHREIAKAEARFRHIVSDVDGVAVQGYRDDGTTILWNPASEKLYGYSAEEALGKKLWELIIPEAQREGVIASVEQMVISGVPQPPADLLLRRKDGTEVAVYSSHSIVTGSDGRRELYCIDIDQSERNRAQAKLRRINQIFNSLGTDPEENIRRIVGEVGELLGAACSLYNKLDDAGESLCAWTGYNLPSDYKMQDAPEGHICYEATMRSPDVPVTISELRGTPYETSDANVAKYGLRSYLGYPVRSRDRIVGALCIVDTVPRDFSETELHIIGTLAKGIGIEEDRKADQRQITALVAEKELLLKELKHRFKNDMVLIKSLLSIQAKQAASPEVAESLREAESRISVVGQVYERLGSFDVRQSIDLLGLVRDVVRDLRGGTLPASVNVEVEGNPTVVSSKVALAVGILVNELVTNSVKHGLGDPPTGNVRIALSKPKESEVAVRIIDDGCGFPDMVLEGAEYGFGLTVVDALTVQHGGRLELRNEDGARAEVRLRVGA
ncbi:MAG: response regulator [Spirochaetaceae bacterium]